MLCKLFIYNWLHDIRPGNLTAILAPFGPLSVQFGPCQVITVTNSELRPIAADDSLGVYATGPTNLPSYKEVGAAEPFNVYRSYRPAGPESETIWVTLQ